jgi:hypothetical protein
MEDIGLHSLWPFDMFSPFWYAAGLPDFSWYKIPKREKFTNQMSIKYNNKTYNGSSFHKICQHVQLQDPPKCTQIWSFGLKTKPSGYPIILHLENSGNPSLYTLQHYTCKKIENITVIYKSHLGD